MGKAIATKLVQKNTHEHYDNDFQGQKSKKQTNNPNKQFKLIWLFPPLFFLSTLFIYLNNGLIHSISIIFQTTTQIHPFVFMFLGYLLVAVSFGALYFFSSAIKQDRLNINKRRLIWVINAFSFVYNILFIYLIAVQNFSNSFAYSNFQSFIFILGFILYLLNILLQSYIAYHLNYFEKYINRVINQVHYNEGGFQHVIQRVNKESIIMALMTCITLLIVSFPLYYFIVSYTLFVYFK